MKLITAYIRPEVLPDVKASLYAGEIYSMSVTNVLGSGQQRGHTEVYRGVQTEVTLLKKLRVEIGVPDARAKAAVDAVIRGARTGAEGDGVIFVQDVAEAVRIRTGEAM